MEWTLIIEWLTKLLIGYLPLLPKSAAGIMSGYLLKRTWRLVMPEKCVIENCNIRSGHQSHGLCMFCYRKALTKVEAGETTWEELASLGLCSGIELDPFTKAYNRAKGSSTFIPDINECEYCARGKCHIHLGV